MISSNRRHTPMPLNSTTLYASEFHHAPMPLNSRVPNNTFKKDYNDNDAAAQTDPRISAGIQRGVSTG